MEHVNIKDDQFLNRKHTFVIVLTKKMDLLISLPVKMIQRKALV